MESSDDIDYKVREARKTIEDLLDSGKLPKVLYYKALIALSYEFAILNRHEDTMTYIADIPSDYFRSEFLKHMHEDRDFKVCAEAVAKCLAAAGYLTTAIGVNGVN